MYVDGLDLPAGIHTIYGFLYVFDAVVVSCIAQIMAFLSFYAASSLRAVPAFFSFLYISRSSLIVVSDMNILLVKSLGFFSVTISM